MIPRRESVIIYNNLFIPSGTRISVKLEYVMEPCIGKVCSIESNGFMLDMSNRDKSYAKFIDFQCVKRIEIVR